MKVYRATVGRYLGLYGALLLLLAINMAITLLPAGIPTTPLHLSVAAISIVLIALIFMRLQSGASLTKLSAVLALLWVCFLFVLTFADYLSR